MSLRRKSPIRVLVVDDSALVRQELKRILSADPDIEVVGTAIDPYAARSKIMKLEPDVMTLDLVMPRMGGLDFLKKVMHYRPMPVVVVSAYSPAGARSALRSLELGAVEVVSKPESDGQTQVEFAVTLCDAVRAAARVNVSAKTFQEQRAGEGKTTLLTSGSATVKSSKISSKKVLAFGASTGGTSVLQDILTSMPLNCPGIAIVQHMPAGFTNSFAARLNELSSIEVAEAKDGMPIERGTALIAPGNKHLMVRASGDGYRAIVREGPLVQRHRPSVNVLFKSVADSVGAAAAGFLLTGMGKDGAEGLLKMREAGSYTVAQDERSSLVFGMPGEAIKLGAAEDVLSIQDIMALLC